MTANRPPHILLVEDEGALGLLLKECFKENHFICRLANNGQQAWEMFNEEKFDICIFDVNLPKKSGFELAKLVREKDEHVPIVFLTANDSEEDKLKGFEIGGDAYITKPFSRNELLARVAAILKRTQKIKHDLIVNDEILTLGDIRIDVNNQILSFNNSDKKLSVTEIAIIKIFINNLNHLIPRANLQLEVWGKNDIYTSRNLDVYINKLRKLFTDIPGIEITNVHGSGFKLIYNKTNKD